MEAVIKIRPYQLMCILCKSESGFGQSTGDVKLKEILEIVRLNPDVPLSLVCNVSGGYSYQNPGRQDDTPGGESYNEKRDIDILQRMGFLPGVVMPARFLIAKLIESVESSWGICGYPGNLKNWQGCSNACMGYYESARKKEARFFPAGRSADECSKAKLLSVEAMYAASVLSIRPHHLMCMACFSAGDNSGAPIDADNLYEAIDIIRKKPAIPVRLIKGACMICPPCSNYSPSKNICVGGRSMSLRDEKKDLDLLQKLDMKYGDVVPAAKLYGLLFDAVKSTMEICGFGDGRAGSREWEGCGMKGLPAYERARKENMKIPGIERKSP